MKRLSAVRRSRHLALVLAVRPTLTGGSPCYLRLATPALIYMAWTVAFNLLFGHPKQLFLCVGALAGSAAYVTVVLTKQSRSPPGSPCRSASPPPPPSARPSATSPSAAAWASSSSASSPSPSPSSSTTSCSACASSPTARPASSPAGLGFPLLEQPLPSYYLFLAVLMLAVSVYYLLMRSRMGMAVRALSDDELSAELSGIDVTWYKVLAAAVASAILGLAGSFYAFYNGIVSPSVFSFVGVDIPVLIALLLGGMRTRLGPILGAAAFAVIEELVRPFGQLNVLVYGVLMIVLFVSFREGMVVMLRKRPRPVPPLTRRARDFARYCRTEIS